MTPLDIAREAVTAATDKKAIRCVLQDLRGLSDLCDYQLVCSGENERQTRAIADSIEERCRRIGNARPIAVEGKQSGNWIMIDFGSTLIHIFYDAVRNYYALESLWPKAKLLPLSPADEAKA